MRSRFRTSLNQVLQSTLMVENMPITLYPTIINPMRERCLIGFQRNRRKRISKRAGFSLLELVIVGAILLITTAMAVPIFQNVRRTYQLRGAVVDLASLLQRSRMFCVRNNRLVPIQTAGGNTQVFLSDVSWQLHQGEPLVQLPANITQTNAGAPLIPAATLGFANPQDPPARFNGRGLPCAFNGAICTNYLPGGGGFEVGFVYYLKQNLNGQQTWAAVSITPAGQVKTWSYSGGNWTNL